MRRLMTIAAVVGAAAALVPARGQVGDGKKEPTAVAKGNNEFAFALYGRLRQKEGNLFFSPASLSAALAMTYAGARGPTAEEMARVLHFPHGQDRLHAAYADFLRGLNEGDRRQPGYQLTVANALWGQKGYSFRPDFLKLTKDHYGAGLRDVDFQADAEGARRAINAWVEKATHDKIKDVLKPGTLDPLSRLVLTNAIYFKGDWQSRFKKDLTRPGAFHVSPARAVRVPLMRQTHRFPYHEEKDFQALEMPYVGKDLSMVVLLPARGVALTELEKRLTADRLAGWLRAMSREEVDVTLPKFKTTSEFNLTDELAALGMRRAFTAGEADFGGMNGGKEELHVGAVVHKAYVDVNEEGTEAAAATGGLIRVRSVSIRPEFRADRPFVFFIRDKGSGAVLFAGRVVNPTK